MSKPGAKFCVRSRAAFAPISGSGPGGLSMEVVRPAAKRGHGSIDEANGLFHLGEEEGKRTETQNGFVFGERLFEESSKQNIIRFMAEEPTFPGIGNVRATKLVDRFGSQLLQAIKEKDPALFDVLPEVVAISLFENFDEAAAAAELSMYLDALLVDKWIGKKVMRAWGKLGAQKLKDNPYLLISWLDWEKVDLIGQRIGKLESDPDRLTAAVEAVLYKRLSNGHTWTDLTEVESRAAKLVGEGQRHNAIDACISNNGALQNSGGLQPIGAAVMERFVMQQSLALEPSQADMFDGLMMREDDFANMIGQIEHQQGFRFTDMQLRAVWSALESRFNVFAGYAGSGKTSVLRAVCALSEASGLKVHLMALSGRAAKRITDATGYKSSTIARFVRDHRGVELEPSNLVVVDEASMVDLADAYRILRIARYARVCLVGDPAQLPPIGFGAPFADLVDYPDVSRVVLDKVHRQGETTGIPTIAKNIREGIVDELPEYNGLQDGVFHLGAKEEDAPFAIFEIGKAFAKAGCDRDDLQIIAPVKRGNGGVTNLNRFMSDLKPNRQLMFGSSGIRVGDPIVYLRNDMDRDLRNGSLGRLLAPDLADFEGNEISLRSDDVESIDLAYCLTVHKSQGSQWDRVIVPLFNVTRSSFVERSLIYTAITRAAKQVVIVGDKEAYANAVRSETAANRRQSGIGRNG